MQSLKCALQFVNDVQIKITITNLSGGIAKFSHDYKKTKKKKRAHSKFYYQETKTIRYNTEDLDAKKNR